MTHEFTYYVQKSFRSETGRTTTKVVERLGIIKELGLDKICKKIEKKHKNGYDLNAILSM
ncbi:MAG: hypothetical protein ACI3ZS_01545 [Candidatus Cryptobacteroides sp.]